MAESRELKAEELTAFSYEFSALRVNLLNGQRVNSVTVKGRIRPKAERGD